MAPEIEKILKHEQKIALYSKIQGDVLGLPSRCGVVLGPAVKDCLIITIITGMAVSICASGMKQFPLNDRAIRLV
jgi:hypothetical protein